MRYEGGHLFFAVVLNTVTPTTHPPRTSLPSFLRHFFAYNSPVRLGKCSGSLGFLGKGAGGCFCRAAVDEVELRQALLRQYNRR